MSRRTEEGEECLISSERETHRIESPFIDVGDSGTQKGGKDTGDTHTCTLGSLCPLWVDTPDGAHVTHSKWWRLAHLFERSDTMGTQLGREKKRNDKSNRKSKK